MSDVGVLPRFLSVLHSLPLWILVGLAAAGYAALFVPSFGGADLTSFREKWGWLCWLDAIVFSILSSACAVDLAVKAARSRLKKRHRHQQHLYDHVYGPLYAELMKIHVTTSSSAGAAYFKQRVENALIELQTIKKKRIALKKAWRALFDKRITEETGEVDYGGAFPIDTIENIVHSHLSYCDDELFELTSRAATARREERVSSGELTSPDVALY